MAGNSSRFGTRRLHGASKRIGQGTQTTWRRVLVAGRHLPILNGLHGPPSTGRPLAVECKPGNRIGRARPPGKSIPNHIDRPINPGHRAAAELPSNVVDWCISIFTLDFLQCAVDECLSDRYDAPKFVSLGSLIRLPMTFCGVRASHGQVQGHRPIHSFAGRAEDRHDDDHARR